MNPSQYLKLAKELQDLVKEVPLNWGAVQNDQTDHKLKIFDIDSFDELKKALTDVNEADTLYFKRRWFLWKCSKCDEYLFNLNGNLKANPNSKDQNYDIEFNNDIQLRFDVKSTLIPKSLKPRTELLLKDPTEMVDFFYEHQSQGLRNHIQNRLFIVHHSFKRQEREMYLRCHWKFKEEAYAAYAAQISSSSKFITYKNVKADVIFILENLDGSFEYRF